MWSAGHALVVCVLALVIGLVLNAPGAHKRAYNLSEGWKRDVALTVTGPLDTVGGALLLDRPRRVVQSVMGRSGTDAIDTEIALPDTKPTATPPSGTPAKVAFTPERRLRFWVAGDSLVITPGRSIVRASGASPVLESVGDVDGLVATGLTRPDVFNWFAEIRKRLTELRPAVVILGLGANDDKAYMTGLPEAVSIVDFGDAAWLKEYARRVGGLMDIVARAGAHSIWIGLPQTDSAQQTQRFDTVNSVIAREARKRPATATYIDTYTLFASDTGGYTQFLPDGAGGEVKVRANDGVHFERTGGDMIARVVLKALNRMYDLTSWRGQGTP